ncbi:PfkB family carbohydrate kinase [Spirillospora sp. NPDC029432]|uniref:carbohydrate kinase family protein n=1 Tax=Spirillospora sp. NPDC029432 TaxID=3154599 RepID=UPI003455F80D
MTVLVVGDVIDDIVVRPQRPVTADSDTPSTITACPGGSGANQAAWLGALGADVRFAGRAGAADVESHTAALAAAGVDARLAADPRAATGRIVVLAEGGRRDMYTDRGANLNLSPADLPDELLDGVRLLHVSGYSLFHPGVRDAVGGLMARARERGVAVSVDPGSAAFLAASGPEAFRAWARGARLIFPNLDEGRLLTGLRDPSDIATALTADHPVVALKLGADGVLVAADDGTRLRLPSAPAEVVDPTGAGDAFCAGFLTAWAESRPLETCARNGLSAAATAIAAVGARPPVTLHPPPHDH